MTVTLSADVVVTVTLSAENLRTYNLVHFARYICFVLIFITILSLQLNVGRAFTVLGVQGLGFKFFDTESVL